MSSETILSKVAQYYTAKVEEHGASPRGVDWNSTDSQELRLHQLLKVIEGPSPFSLNDYGCGYGRLAAHLREQGIACTYHGFDIAERMIASARRLLPELAGQFTTDEAALPIADFTIASGIFNVRLDTPIPAWEDYTLRTLDRLHALSTRGFSFNMLTKYSDPERMRADLYYADPCLLFDYCKKHYSRRVSLLHDYPLYEFTMIVRKS